MSEANALQNQGRQNGASHTGPDESLLIESMRITAFGKFIDVVIDDVRPGLNVVFGPNEAGKSTLYSYLTTMLFGVYPTNPEQHPYMPEDGRHLVAEIRYAGRGGRKVAVERKLMSTPAGTIIIDGKAERLNQSTIPEAEFLTREVYSSVFALTLDDLVAPRNTPGWEKIQDRLLGGSGIGTLNSSREVSAGFNADASALWRDSRRGKPRADDLLRQIAECKREEREASRRGESERALTDELAEVENELSVLSGRKRHIDARLARLRTIMPADRLLRTLEECRKESEDVDRYDAIPDNPIGALKAFESRSGREDENLKAVAVKRDRCLRDVAAAGDMDRQLAGQTADVRRWEVRCGALRGDLDRLAQDVSELERLAADRDALASQLLTDGWTEETEDRLNRVSLAELKATVDACSRARREADELRRRPVRAEHSTRQISSPVLWTAAIAGTIIFLTGVFMGNAVVAGLGAVLVTFSSIRLTDRPKPDEPDAVSRDEVQAAIQRCSTLQRRIHDILSGLDIPAERLADPDASLVHDVQALVSSHQAIVRSSEAVDRLDRHIRDAQREFEEYVALLALPRDLETSGDMERRIALLVSFCEEAEERVRRSVDAQEALKEHDEAIGRLEISAARLKGEADDLARVLTEIGDGDIHAGGALLESRREMRAYARTIERQIRDQMGTIGDAATRVDEARAEDPGLFRDHAETELEADRARLDEKLLELTGRRSDLTKDLEALKMKPTLPDVQSELEQLQVKLYETKWERDRLALAAAIVNAADARYRAEHQPDVIRRAWTYFESMTCGRYDRISIDGDALTIRQSSDQRYLDLTATESRVSRGTRDQLYLALRLALIDHLDVSHTRLPVFLDEVLVNWDGARRIRGLKTIAEMSQHRQVFLFTCHEWLRDEAAAHVMAHVISLE